MNRQWVAPLPEVSTALTPWTSIDIHEAGESPSWRTSNPRAADVSRETHMSGHE